MGRVIRMFPWKPKLRLVGDAVPRVRREAPVPPASEGDAHLFCPEPRTGRCYEDDPACPTRRDEA